MIKGYNFAKNIGSLFCSEIAEIGDHVSVTIGSRLKILLGPKKNDKKMV